MPQGYIVFGKTTQLHLQFVRLIAFLGGKFFSLLLSVVSDRLNIKLAMTVSIKLEYPSEIFLLINAKVQKCK